MINIFPETNPPPSPPPQSVRYIRYGSGVYSNVKTFHLFIHLAFHKRFLKCGDVRPPTKNLPGGRYVPGCYVPGFKASEHNAL
jgi:hypothetical protein